MKILLTQIAAPALTSEPATPRLVITVPGPAAPRLLIAVPGSISGPQGAPGPPGPQGPAGGTTFTFTQASPLSSWVIVHNLNRFPAVAVVDSTGREVEGDLSYDSANQLTVSFAAGFAGAAFLN